MDLLIIATEPDPEFRARLLWRWLRPYCRPVMGWDQVSELWFSEYELDPQKHLSEDQALLYDEMVKLTWLQQVFGMSGPLLSFTAGV